MGWCVCDGHRAPIGDREALENKEDEQKGHEKVSKINNFHCSRRECFRIRCLTKSQKDAEVEKAPLVDARPVPCVKGKQRSRRTERSRSSSRLDRRRRRGSRSPEEVVQGLGLNLSSGSRCRKGRMPAHSPSGRQDRGREYILRLTSTAKVVGKDELSKRRRRQGSDGQGAHRPSTRGLEETSSPSRESSWRRNPCSQGPGWRTDLGRGGHVLWSSLQVRGAHSRGSPGRSRPSFDGGEDPGTDKALT